jgi:hypothetical protein
MNAFRKESLNSDGRQIQQFLQNMQQQIEDRKKITIYFH